MTGRTSIEPPASNTGQPVEISIALWRSGASMNITPVIAGDRIIDSGLDHHVYCLNKKDGTLIWDYETGFEVDGSVVVVDDKLYFGGEDHSLYCLTLADGKLVYKIPDVGSVEGSITYKDGRIYLSTEQFYLYCFNRMLVAVLNLIIRKSLRNRRYQASSLITKNNTRRRRSRKIKLRFKVFLLQ